MDEHTEPDATTIVELRVTADPIHLALLRMVAETTALTVDLTLDEASDVRLAVDEAASLLMEYAVPGTMLSVRFSNDSGEFAVRLWATAAAAVVPDRDGFSWQILRGLTDWIEIDQQPYDVGREGYPTCVHFSRVR